MIFKIQLTLKLWKTLMISDTLVKTLKILNWTFLYYLWNASYSLF